ncbi:hypothetical protein CJF32_00010408 [Rutstroemia sp. NJR-2017a WRK4]|nr:hypothetical protein CJF32_00010408 [Rutstroemia sp. NJR-2017a WRK4]
MHRLLGNRYSSILSNNSGEMIAYLQLLDKVLPDPIVCRPCERLHKIANAEWYTNNDSTAVLLIHAIRNRHIEARSIQEVLSLIPRIPSKTLQWRNQLSLSSQQLGLMVAA